MYSLILGSKLDGAKRFKRWVTSEILPAIRKTGAFATDSAAAELKARELRVKEMNAQARLINAETRRLLILQKEKGWRIPAQNRKDLLRVRNRKRARNFGGKGRQDRKRLRAQNRRVRHYRHGQEPLQLQRGRRVPLQRAWQAENQGDFVGE